MVNLQEEVGLQIMTIQNNKVQFNMKSIMRKFVFRFFTMAMIAISGVPFTSCSDDDNNENGSASSVNNPLVSEGGLLLTSISEQRGSSYDMDTYYIYYDAKLRPYKYSSNYEDLLIIDYDNSKMDMPDWSGASNLSLSFNSKGYITKVKGSWSYSEDGENFSGSLEWSASYDKNGHLTEMTTNEEEKSDEYNDKGTSKATLSWSDGNLVSYKSESKWFDEDGKLDESGSSTVTFTYGTQLNKYKQYPAVISFDDEGGLFNMGLFGLGPNMLPTSYKEVYVEEYNGQNHEYSYNSNSTFTLNDNGSIATEIWSGDNGTAKYVFGYSDAKSVAKGITRSGAAASTMSATDKAKRIRDFMHNLPFVPKRRSGK